MNFKERNFREGTGGNFRKIIRNTLLYEDLDKILWCSTWKFNSGTVVILNSLGDIFDWKTIGKISQVF